MITYRLFYDYPIKSTFGDEMMQANRVMRRMLGAMVAVALSMATVSVLAEEAPAAAPAAGGDKPYTITGGKVDEATFTGWQTYRTVGCGQCHGGSGQGGAAPSLVERLKTVDKATFTTSVMNGKNLMPPWKGNPKVVANIDKIYAYLKARSDGALGEEKPEKQ
jgi:mono/diheme cytochrome c family protein